MAPDQKGIQSARIGIFHRRMLGKLAELAQRGRADPQLPAHFAGPVDRSRRDPLGQKQGVKLTVGLRPEVEGRDRLRNAAQTAGEGHWGVQTLDPLPMPTPTPHRRLLAGLRAFSGSTSDAGSAHRRRG